MAERTDLLYMLATRSSLSQEAFIECWIPQWDALSSPPRPHRQGGHHELGTGPSSCKGCKGSFNSGILRASSRALPSLAHRPEILNDEGEHGGGGGSGSGSGSGNNGGGHEGGGAENGGNGGGDGVGDCGGQLPLGDCIEDGGADHEDGGRGSVSGACGPGTQRGCQAAPLTEFSPAGIAGDLLAHVSEHVSEHVSKKDVALQPTGFRCGGSAVAGSPPKPQLRFQPPAIGSNRNKTLSAGGTHSMLRGSGVGQGVGDEMLGVSDCCGSGTDGHEAGADVTSETPQLLPSLLLGVGMGETGATQVRSATHPTRHNRPTTPNHSAILRLVLVSAQSFALPAYPAQSTPCPILSCSALPCPVPPCSVPPCPVHPCPIHPCPIHSTPPDPTPHTPIPGAPNARGSPTQACRSRQALAQIGQGLHPCRVAAVEDYCAAGRSAGVVHPGRW